MALISKPLFIVLTATALGSGLAGYVWHEENRLPQLELYIFALSSGRSMFIRTPDDKRIVVDGGANFEIIRHLSKILPFYSRRIDAVIVTNTEGKNVGGLIDLVQRYEIGQVYLPAVTLQSLALASSSDQVFDVFMKVLNEKSLPLHKIGAGDFVILDKKSPINILFPADSSNFAYSKTSAPEILFELFFGQTRIVFMGDASNKTQKFIASNSLNNINSFAFPEFTDVLIVSRSALPANIAGQLIEKIKPRYLVYSKSPTSRSYKQTQASSSSKKKKESIDSLEYIKADQRFNLKEKGTVKVVSDGIHVNIGYVGEQSSGK